MVTLINEKCPTCAKRFFFESDKRKHRCDPVFWIYCNDYLDVPESQRASDFQEAAEKWAEAFDQDDYPLMGSGEVDLVVMSDGLYQRLNEDILARVDPKDWRSESKLWAALEFDEIEDAQQFSVAAESIPTYTATKK